MYLFSIEYTNIVNYINILLKLVWFDLTMIYNLINKECVFNIYSKLHIWVICDKIPFIILENMLCCMKLSNKNILLFSHMNNLLDTV